MTKDKTALLKEINAIVSQCDRCGSCHLVCPLFAVKDREVCGSRGKINAARALIKGGIAPEAAILEAVEFCLLCGACTDVCASKVKTPDAMMKVRQYLAASSQKSQGYSDTEKQDMERGYQTLVECCKNLPSAKGAQDTKVSYFFGCTARLTSPDSAIQTVKLLASTANVALKNSACCGLPALIRGRIDEYLENTKKNIELYKEANTIVCDCAGCSDVLKKAASYLADDAEWAERGKVFSQKVVSLSEYLAKIGYTPPKKVAEKITYQDPCRLGRNQGIKKAPRDLLKAAGDYVEMPGSDTCCGGSCFFPSDYPEAADALAAKKQASIEKTGASIVATECHRCLGRLKKVAAKSGGKFRAVHISELL
ncbi:(Fe-S)-binding protein [Acetonema longum]|uniref:4Fe-4S ferredoxin-type domain-containing protein n=1 Tax=Acetonema longum DSM 6540 TaxID=1009370 RepID=F7NHU9_9FIRM|nr:(Fe-S)-binding protein [Acetonema longum]EGO64474.1 hypothetical protein ALO_08233 [Acetonema longum DSM 6540]